MLDSLINRAYKVLDYNDLKGSVYISIITNEKGEMVDGEKVTSILVNEKEIAFSEFIFKENLNEKINSEKITKIDVEKALNQSTKIEIGYLNERMLMLKNKTN